MSDPRPSAQLIPFGEVQRLVQERRRHARPGSMHGGSFSQPRSTAQVRRMLTEHRAGPPSGPEAA